MVEKIFNIIILFISLVLLSPFLIFIFSMASLALFVGLILFSAVFVAAVVYVELHDHDKDSDKDTTTSKYYREINT